MSGSEEKKKEGLWLKVFCPEARCLREEEVFEIPAAVRFKAEAGSEKGLWLEVFCPDGACLRDEEPIDRPVLHVPDADRGGLWLNLFCPEETCGIDSPTDLA